MSSSLSFFTFFNEKIKFAIHYNTIFIVHLPHICKVYLTKMANKIKHLGIVENINGSCVQVRIQQTSACSSCSVKGHCNASETKEKLINVYNRNHLDCRVGDQVLITGTVSMGMKAVWLAFVFPFLILFLVLFITMKLTEENEAVSAIVALAMLIPYYLIVYMCRSKLDRTFMFTLETIK